MSDRERPLAIFPDDPAPDPWPVWIVGRGDRDVKTYPWTPVDGRRGSVCIGLTRPGRYRADIVAHLTVDQARELACALLDASDELERHERERAA